MLPNTIMYAGITLTCMFAGLAEVAAPSSFIVGSAYVYGSIFGVFGGIAFWDSKTSRSDKDAPVMRQLMTVITVAMLSAVTSFIVYAILEAREIQPLYVAAGTAIGGVCGGPMLQLIVDASLKKTSEILGSDKETTENPNKKDDEKTT